MLNEHNKFETVKALEVSRKVEIIGKKFAVTTDAENNVIQRFTIVKIKDRSSPMFG